MKIATYVTGTVHHRIEKYHGYLYHYYDVTRHPNCIGNLMGNRKIQCVDYWERFFNKSPESTKNFLKFLWEYFPEVK